MSECKVCGSETGVVFNIGFSKTPVCDSCAYTIAAQQAVCAESERDRLKAELKAIRDMVDKQAEDEGLWFDAVTCPEAYLQRELRKLHAAIEGEGNG